MDPTSSIRRLGFRKWYERELIKCHAALVTCFLCGLTVAALLEAVSFENFGPGPISMLAIVFAAIAIGWASWRTYITLLQRAERYGERSSCPSCKSYGRFNILSTGVVAGPADPWLQVQCRRCGTAWRMPD